MNGHGNGNGQGKSSANGNGRSDREQGTGEFAVHPKVFVFFDRRSGAPRFEVKADPDGTMPGEEVAGLLAMNCMVHGREPEDYAVMVETSENLLGGLVGRTRRLIRAGLSFASPMNLSQRQQEVLQGVLENLSNKQIAARLNVSERMAKFHVLALLGKFEVTSRVDLMRTAGDLLSAGRLATNPVMELARGRAANQAGGKSREAGQAANEPERRAAKAVFGGD
jgi:DNA-binding CsgD family transcriptional regulator